MSGVSLLGFDPGGTTGFARVWLPRSALERRGSILGTMEFSVAQIPGDGRAQGREIALLLAEYSGPIVIEDFLLRKFSRDRDLLAPVRMIERIEQICDFRNDNKFTGSIATFYQQPAMAKSTCTDERMRSWGIWTPGQPHANDALRHCVTFLRRCKNDAELRLAAFGF